MSNVHNMEKSRKEKAGKSKKVLIISVLGSGRNSGKTTLACNIVKELKKQGFKVASIKKIHEEDFTIDKEGKDSYRLAEAGADVVVTAAPKEIAVIKKVEKGKRLIEAMKFLSAGDFDFVVVEGNADKLKNYFNVKEVFICRNESEVKSMGIDAERFACIASLTPENFREIKALHAEKEISKIVDKLLS